MGQITKETIRMVRVAHVRGDHASLTIGEEEELLYAWEELQRRLKIDEVFALEPLEYSNVLEKFNLGRFTGGMDYRWDWKRDKVQTLTLEDAEQVLRVCQRQHDAKANTR